MKKTQNSRTSSAMRISHGMRFVYPDLLKALAWAVIAACSIALNMSAQVMVPYTYDWDAPGTTTANDGWEIQTTGDSNDIHSISESIHSDGSGGMTLRVGAEFVTPDASLRLEKTDAINLPTDGSLTLAEMSMSMDVFSSQAGKNLLFTLEDDDGEFDTLEWSRSNDQANMWQSHSFDIANARVFDEGGDPFGSSPDHFDNIRFSIVMEHSQFGAGFHQFQLDNFSIPEPHEYALVSALGLGVVIFMRRRKLKSTRCLK